MITYKYKDKDTIIKTTTTEEVIHLPTIQKEIDNLNATISKIEKDIVSTDGLSDEQASIIKAVSYDMSGIEDYKRMRDKKIKYLKEIKNKVEDGDNIQRT